MLKTSKFVEVRFSDVDAMDIVWHGNYIKYFEDGREDFGKKYALSYLHLTKHRFLAPIVEVVVNFKKKLCYGDSIVIETAFVEQDSTKLVFDYQIFNAGDKSLTCTGRTVQVFVDADYNLQLAPPEFFVEWKEKWLRPTKILL